MMRRVLLTLTLLAALLAIPASPAAANTGQQPSLDFDRSISVTASSATFTGNGQQIIIQTPSGGLIAHRLADGAEWILPGADPITQLNADSVDTWGTRVVFSDASASKVWFPQEDRVEVLGPPHTEVGVGYFDRSPGYWVWDGSAFDFIDQYDSTRTEVDIDFVPLTLGGFSALVNLETTTSFTTLSLYDFTESTSAQRCQSGQVSCDMFLAQHFGWSAHTEVAADFNTHRFLYLLLNTHLYSSNYVMEIESDRIDLFTRIFAWRGKAEHASTLDQLMLSWDYSVDDARVTRLYQAFFGRTPDLGGLQYWLDLHHNGTSLDELAFWFSRSVEFKNAYDGTSDAVYVDRVYQNVLGRDYDQEGYQYWLGLLTNGELDRAGVVRWVTANGEFIKNYPYLP